MGLKAMVNILVVYFFLIIASLSFSKANDEILNDKIICIKSYLKAIEDEPKYILQSNPSPHSFTS